MNSHPGIPVRHPSNAGIVHIVGRLDGSTVTISTQPAPSGTDHVVVLRVQSPMLDVLAASFLAADEAYLLADALSTAASAAVEPPTGPSGGGPTARGTGGERAEYVVSAAEETTAEELGRALASVPAGSRLTDFASDVDVTLIFTSAATDPPDVPVGNHPRKAEQDA
jgi:uncharacterized repeat protein (TIGR03917 family)